MFTITVGTLLAGINITSAGPVHSVFTVTGASTAGLNSTVQVRMTLAPAITLNGAVTVTAVGAGTGGEKNYSKDPMHAKKFFKILQSTSTLLLFSTTTLPTVARHVYVPA